MDIAARNAMVVGVMPAVKAIARSIYDSIPLNTGLTLDDLIQAGWLGALDAADKFDGGAGVLFLTYARRRIVGAIIDSLRDEDYMSRQGRRFKKMLEDYASAFFQRFGRDPREEEIAEHFGLSVSVYRSRSRLCTTTRPINICCVTEEGKLLERADFIHPLEDDSHSPEDLLLAAERCTAVQAAQATLSERYRRVIELYYGAEMTMKEVGSIMGINESRVSQIHAQAVAKIRAALAEQGICSSQF